MLIITTYEGDINDFSHTQYEHLLLNYFNLQVSARNRNYVSEKYTELK